MANKKRLWAGLAVSILLVFAIALILHLPQAPKGAVYPRQAAAIQADGTLRPLSVRNSRGASRITAQTASSLSYEEALDPNAFYVLNIQLTDIQAAPEATVTIRSRHQGDINQQRVFPSLSCSDTGGEAGCKRVVKTDAEGKLSFTIEISQAFEGSISVQCLPLAEDPQYTLVASEDHRVRMVFLTEDIRDHSPEAWIWQYASLRAALKAMTGRDEPYAGTTDYLFTEDLGYLGLAGDPIYIHRQYVPELLKTMGSAGDFSWELAHEMSHTFDGIQGSRLENTWNFDPEFFANLKAFCVLKEKGYFTAQRTADYLESLEPMNTLNNRVYTSDGFTYRFLSVILAIDEAPAAHLHRIFRSMAQQQTPSDDPGRFSLFLSAFQEEYGVSLYSFLTENECRTLQAKYMAR